MKACRRIGLHGLKPHDFRHNFLTLVYQGTKGLRVTGTFGGIARHTRRPSTRRLRSGRLCRTPPRRSAHDLSRYSRRSVHWHHFLAQFDSETRGIFRTPREVPNENVAVKTSGKGRNFSERVVGATGFETLTPAV